MPLPAADLGKSLTFHADFDATTDARRATGDKRIYTAAAYKEQAAAKPGLDHPDVELAPGEGRFGGALSFKKKNVKAVFYKAEKNAAFDPKNWTGTISFWLSLDPNQDLEPGFCDPIQVTDKAYNDDAIWVDFTKDERPRHFRLGVFGDLKAWNPQNLPADKYPDFNKRLVVNRNPPFARGKWTHVVITHTGLGSGNGEARLYLDGRLQGAAEHIKEPFSWNLATAAIRVGVNYVGLFDDLAMFNRALTAGEVKSLHGLKKGIASLKYP
ncbi:MAG: LamG domain-containing protein [Candidatus Solibacter usitatus]|nr:LamG domain-containing protein [Candidatus Solibacter usitatus]